MNRLFFVPALICGMVFNGCEKATDENKMLTPAYGAVDMKVAVDLENVCNKHICNVQYIRTGGFVDGKNYPVFSAISSKSELEQYFEAHTKIYGLSTDLQNSIKNYSDGFFANSFLVIVLVQEGSGSVGHNVEGIDKDGDIIISRFIPEFGTADMALWSIIIELDNSIEFKKLGVALVDKKAQ